MVPQLTRDGDPASGADSLSALLWPASRNGRPRALPDVLGEPSRFRIGDELRAPRGDGLHVPRGKDAGLDELGVQNLLPFDDAYHARRGGSDHIGHDGGPVLGGCAHGGHDRTFVRRTRTLVPRIHTCHLPTHSHICYVDTSSHRALYLRLLSLRKAAVRISSGVGLGG